LMPDPEDADKSSSLVDITVSCQDGCLIINLDSFWNEQDNKKLLSVMNDRLCEITQLAASRTTSVTQPRMNGVPSALSEEEFIPYFEYREAPRQGPILFLLPPGEGGAESYFNNIVKYLPNSNLVCFNNYYLQTKKLQTFEELADFYLPFIQGIQPSGPYHLLGWSFGGILAMEIAQRLVNKYGEKIGSLSFIDSYFEVNKAARDIGVAEGINILDPIHHIYQPNSETLKHVAIETDRVVFFKASLSNDKYASGTEKRLYEYYNHTTYHNLDTLIPKDSIDLITLEDATHFSWVHNEQQIVSICATLKTILRGG
jgi:N-(5-amino-5-carboxypentanoyl)-L-cysteinyl-D-valine synthase